MNNNGILFNQFAKIAPRVNYDGYLYGIKNGVSILTDIRLKEYEIGVCDEISSLIIRLGDIVVTVESDMDNYLYNGICNTPAINSEKIIDIDNFRLKPNIILFVKFTDGNAADSCKLNISNTGAKNIISMVGNINEVISSSIYHIFLYDGTSFNLLNPIIQDRVNEDSLTNIWFANVSGMKSCSTLMIGDVCKTLGYYSSGDDGAATYIIEAGGGIDDAGFTHEIINGFKAKLQIENSVINIKQLGALGDGVFNDTVSVKLAANSGKQIYFPKGTYLLHSQIDQTSDIMWEGDGDDSVIKLMPDDQTRPESYGGRTVYNSYMINQSSSSYSMVLNNITLDANSTDYDNDTLNNGSSRYDHTICLNLQSPKYVNLNNVIIKNALFNGSYIDNTNNVDIVIDNCKFLNNGLYQENASGLYILNGGHRVLISSCVFNNNGYHGLQLDGSEYSNINNISCCDNGFDGLFLCGGSSHNIINSIQAKNNRGGVHIKSGFNNDFRDEDGDLIPLSNGNIINGLITNNNKYGILFGNSLNTLINGWNSYDKYNYLIGYSDRYDKLVTGSVINSTLENTSGYNCFITSANTDRFAIKFIEANSTLFKISDNFDSYNAILEAGKLNDIGQNESMENTWRFSSYLYVIENDEIVISTSVNEPMYLFCYNESKTIVNLSEQYPYKLISNNESIVISADVKYIRFYINSTVAIPPVATLTYLRRNKEELYKPTPSVTVPSHASESPSYGNGTVEKYGHVKLSDSITSNLDETSGVAATPKAINTLNNKITDMGVTSIYSFGAKGDGITNDTVALKAAAQSGKVIYFPRGTYLLYEQIDINTDINWYGDGESTIIKLMPYDKSRPEAYDGRTVYNTYMLSYDRYNHDSCSLSLQSLCLDANKDGYQNDILDNGSNIHDHIVCVDLYNPRSVYLNNVTIENALIEGCYIYAKDGQSIIISNSKFNGNGIKEMDASGLHIEGNGQNTIITNCIFDDNGYHGLLLGGLNGSTVSNISCIGNGREGLCLWGGSSDNVISNVYSKGNRGGVNIKSAYSTYIRDEYESWNNPASGNIITGLKTEKNKYGILFGNSLNTMINGWNSNDTYNYLIGYSSNFGQNVTGLITNAYLTNTSGYISCLASTYYDMFDVRINRTEESINKLASKYFNITMTLGSLSRTDGSESSSTDFIRSGFIPLTYNQESIYLSSNGIVGCFLCYDSDKNFIETWNEEYSYAYKVPGSKFIPPINCAYVRIRVETNVTTDTYGLNIDADIDSVYSIDHLNIDLLEIDRKITKMYQYMINNNLITD